MRVYIAGKITGDPNYHEKFERAALKLFNLGYSVENPATADDGLSYKDYIDRGLELLKGCSAIYLLDDWDESPGARLEAFYAMTVGLRIMHEVPNE